MGDMRSEQEALERLERENFDLKLRLFYLEEAAKRELPLSPTGSAPPREDASGQVPKEDVAFQLEEKSIEIEQKNLLIFKAKRAIEALKAQVGDLERDKATNAQTMIELKQSFEIRVAEVEGRGREREEALQLGLKDLERAKDGLVEELTQSRALVDIYSMRIEELGAEIEELRAASLEAKQETDQVRQRCEDRLRQVRGLLEQTAAKEQAEYEKRLNELSIKHQEVLGQAARSQSKDLETLRAGHQVELGRTSEQYESRLAEMTEEVRRLRANVEDLTRQREQLVADLTVAKDMQSKQDLEIASLVSSTAAQNDAIRTLKRSLELNKDQRRAQFEYESEFREDLLRERAERAQLAARLEEKSAALDSLNGSYRECQAALKQTESELIRVGIENRELSLKASAVEETSRENERLKASLNSIGQEVAAAKHSLELKERDSILQQQRSTEMDHLNRMKTEELKAIAAENERLQLQLGKHLGEFEVMRSENTRLQESIRVLEQDSSLIKREVDQAKESRAELLRLHVEADRAAENARRITSKLFSITAHAMEDWRDALSIAIEGEALISKETVKGAQSNFSVKGVETSDSEGMVENSLLMIQTVNSLISRLGRVKTYYKSSTATLQKSLENNMSAFSDKLALMEIRLETSLKSVERVQNTVDRDHRLHRHESDELKELKGLLLKEHQERLRDDERKFIDLKVHYEQIQVDLKQWMDRCNELEKHNNALQLQNNDMKYQLERFSEAESTLRSLESRALGLAEENAGLVAELEKRDHQISRLRVFLEEDKSERTRLAATNNQISEDLASKTTELSRLIEKIDELESEISRLRRREMDPSLAKALRESLNVLNTASAPTPVMQPAHEVSFQTPSIAKHYEPRPSALKHEDLSAIRPNSPFPDEQIEFTPSRGITFSSDVSSLRHDSALKTSTFGISRLNALREAKGPAAQEGVVVYRGNRVSAQQHQQSVSPSTMFARYSRSNPTIQPPKPLPTYNIADVSPFRQDSSLSRISKLGEDLNKLATRLDNLDSRKGKVVNVSIGTVSK